MDTSKNNTFKDLGLVSIILPTFNAGKFISKSISSILNQTYKNFELIIIDDGSTDNTLDQIIKFNDNRIKLLKNDKNIGLPKTLNKGIQISKGKYTARADADDKWIDRNKLEKQIMFLKANPSYVLIGTGAIKYTEKNKISINIMPPLNDKNIRDKMFKANHFFHSCVVFKKKDFLFVGGYSENPKFQFVEDWDLWFRLGLIGKMKNLENFALKCLISNNSISAKNRISQYKQNINLIKKYKSNYPNYYKYLIFNYIKLFLYGYLNLTKIKNLSLKIKNKFNK